MKHLLYIIMCVLCGVMTSCGNDDEFVINCEIKGIGNKGVEMIYFNRGLRKAAFHPVDDKVSLRGSAPDLTVVEVFSLDNKLLFSCVAQNGDELNVKLDIDNPASLKVKGNEVSKQYAAFVSENAELLGSRDDAGVNALIRNEISAHPDRICSTVILTRLFRTDGYEMLADSLINILKPEARPSSLIKGYAAMVGEQVSTSARGEVRTITFHTGRDTVSGRDTTVRFMPMLHSYSLLVFSNERKSDTITNKLKELKKDYAKRRFEALEISFDNDSSSWRLSINGDSAKWLQAWAPGGNAGSQVRNLAIPSTPFFIVTDSTGKQLYRGKSIRAANDTIRERLKSVPVETDTAKTDDTAAEKTVKLQAPPVEKGSKTKVRPNIKGQRPPSSHVKPLRPAHR